MQDASARGKAGIDMNMEWIMWDATLCLGNARLDGEHQKLAAIINKMADGVMHRPGLHSHRELLRELIEHTVAHFAEEDRLMAAHCYPQADSHRAEHDSLIQTAHGFMAELDTDPSPTAALLHFLRRWLTRHVLAMDKALVDYLENSR